MVSWTGMRGVVTLAAAAGIPAVTAAGEPFPQRATIQAIAFLVSVGTLLLQGWTLPLLIRRLNLASSEEDQAYDRGETLKAERVVREAADAVLAEFAADPPPGLRQSALDEITRLISRHAQDADEMPDPDAHTLRAEVFSALYREVLSAQRGVLIAHRDAGAIGELQPGDLLFFVSADAPPVKPPGKPKITHVGVYIGDGQFVHATTSDRPTVHKTALREAGWLKRWAGTRRHEQLATQAP